MSLRFAEPTLEVPKYYPNVELIEDKITVTETGEFVIEGLAKAVAKSRESFFFANGACEINNGGLVSGSCFTLLDREMQPNQNAMQNKVFFGTLSLYQESGESHSADIACKRVEGCSGAAVHEMAASMVIDQHTDAQSLKPFGIYTDSEGTVHYMTVLEPAAQPIDQLGFEDGAFIYKGAAVTAEEVLRLLGYSFARLHQKGFFHRDSQLRNAIITSSTVKIVDLEYSRQFPLEDKFRQKICDLSKQDTRNIIASIDEYCRDRKIEGDERNKLIDSFYGAYIGMMRHPSSPLAQETSLMEL